jgi:sugar phosphate isomerase/epimerase
MSQIALSTMWMLNRHNSLGEFFDAAREVGFETFELNHFVSRELVNGSRMPNGAVRSVHAPCPTDPRTQNAEVSSLDKEERALAVEAVQASISLAQHIGAEAVILHAGYVPVSEELEKELRQLYNHGLQNSSRYQDVQAELIEARARDAARHVDATRRSLERLASVADSAGVRIGLENRFFYNEIPLPDEMDLIAREFSGPVGFWLDSGHACVQEALGFVPHREWLNGFSQHLLGVHLHDVRLVPQAEAAPGDEPPADEPPAEVGRLRDHQIPGTGVVDFAEVLSKAGNAVLRTAEVDWYHSAEEVRAGLDFLQRFGRT